MKKTIIAVAIAVVLLAGCGTESAVSTGGNAEPTATVELETPKNFWDGDLGGDIPYESGTFRIKQLAFTESKEGAYYTAYAAVIFDLSGLSEDERQWFKDGFGDLYGQDISLSTVVEIDDDMHFLHMLSADLIELEGVPAFSVIYDYKKYKHSIEGTFYNILLMVDRGDENDQYSFSGNVVLGEGG